ncbi:unnamed protein product [Rhizoctonia solani]|uniref:Fungal-type protein kinase domain-containing protein n=1 Tax=Rhizoctonia solani TaxID=456999 RepID=A0A8H3BHV8_9AGAM|nr:unnamed protein product [Rhizoctonia solani]CAE6490288.1 unnamed protein product [Rhizoctonia solani]
MTRAAGGTPTRTKHTQSPKYRSPHVDNARSTLTNDIPEVPEVKLLPLMNAVLIDIPLDQLNSVCDKLISDGHIIYINKNPKWRCLPRNPSTVKKPETEVFKFIVIIINLIDASCSEQSDVNCLADGDRGPTSFRHDRSRPDGFFYLGEQQKRSNLVMWLYVFFTLEFKKAGGKDNQIDNRAKMMWSLHHMMRNDARRRFVHGMTCENTKARLWYHDRCDIVASEEFDLNKDWKHLVRIVLSYLDPSPVVWFM